MFRYSAVCLNAESSCFPVKGAVMVNPKRRLAVRGACTEECEGDRLDFR